MVTRTHMRRSHTHTYSVLVEQLRSVTGTREVHSLEGSHAGSRLETNHTVESPHLESSLHVAQTTAADSTTNHVIILVSLGFLALFGGAVGRSKKRSRAVAAELPPDVSDGLGFLHFNSDAPSESVYMYKEV